MLIHALAIPVWAKLRSVDKRTIQKSRKSENDGILTAEVFLGCESMSLTAPKISPRENYTIRFWAIVQFLAQKRKTPKLSLRGGLVIGTTSLVLKGGEGLLSTHPPYS